MTLASGQDDGKALHHGQRTVCVNRFFIFSSSVPPANMGDSAQSTAEPTAAPLNGHDPDPPPRPGAPPDTTHIRRELETDDGNGVESGSSAESKRKTLFFDTAKLNVEELRDELRARGENTVGLKSVLIDRLVASIAAPNGNPNLMVGLALCFLFLSFPFPHPLSLFVLPLCLRYCFFENKIGPPVSCIRSFFLSFFFHYESIWI